jgi:hypothetical protein
MLKGIIFFCTHSRSAHKWEKSFNIFLYTQKSKNPQKLMMRRKKVRNTHKSEHGRVSEWEREEKMLKYKLILINFQYNLFHISDGTKCKLIEIFYTQNKYKNKNIIGTSWRRVSEWARGREGMKKAEWRKANREAVMKRQRFSTLCWLICMHMHRIWFGICASLGTTSLHNYCL